MDDGLSGLVELTQCLFALGWCWAVGAAVVSLLTSRLPREEFHATAAVVGIGVISLELFGFSWLGLPWSPLPIAAVGLPVVAFALGRTDLQVQYLPVMVRPDRAPQPGDRVRRTVATAPLALLSILIVVSTCAAWLIPSGRGPNPDGYGFYLLKARMFFTDSGITTYFKDHAGLGYTVPDHPILMSLAISWIYLAIGEVRQPYAALVNPIFLVAMVTVSYGFARRMGLSLGMAATLSAILGATLLTYVRMVAYTDLAVGVYLLVAVNFVARWLDERRAGYAVLGALCLGFAAWTKNEGLAMYYVSAGCLIVLAAHQLTMKRGLRPPVAGWLILLLLPYMLTWPWQQLKSAYAVTLVHGELASLTSTAALLALISERVVPLALWLTLRAALLWHVLFLLFAIALAVNVRRAWITAAMTDDAPGSDGRRGLLATLLVSVDPLRLYTSLLILGTVMAYLVGMLTSPDPVSALIRHATPRLMTQVTPLFFMMLAFELGTLLSHERTPIFSRTVSHRPSIHTAALARSS